MNSAASDQESTVRPHISARREEIEIIYTPTEFAGMEWRAGGSWSTTLWTAAD